ncbi:RHOMBOID-like protein [Heracleum sosnowskyi]|uniref:RHOMBOID-like protein n=1 Tax=Heracleum sosnowskyi TaxID=360622 RepID=A0AAD8HR40_9APIA|nr:RHOMBOID-like protein [Heracleum sosnowskyi]
MTTSPIAITLPLPSQQPRFSIDVDDTVPAKRLRVPFFKSLRHRKENAWIISLFVFLQVIVFASTMFINNCWHNSHRDCAFQSLGRFSFQPLRENLLLGPSASTLDEMGALRTTLLVKDHGAWRFFTSVWLHSGVFHLIINLISVLFVGLHLEQEFGPLRIGVIYLLSAITGSMVAALFLQDKPTVTSSGALFGLLGTMLSALIQNWKIYSKKSEAFGIFYLILVINILLGLLPYINNFSNIGGFLGGFLLGFVLLFKPDLRKMSQSKAGLFEYEVKHSFQFRQRLDRPVLRIVSLAIFSLLLAGLTLAYLHGINMNKSCPSCQYMDCIPSNWWTCSGEQMLCETMVNEGRLTLTCDGSDKFKVFPFNLSQARINDVCNLICS